MRCKICKYKQDIANSKETEAAICTRQAEYFPVKYNDFCHLIPQKRKLVCGDCARFGEDFACMEAKPDSNAYVNGKLCAGFVDAKKQEFMEIFMFWKSQNLYDRAELEKIIDELENFYDDIELQESDNDKNKFP